MLGLQVDTARLFDQADPAYAVWLSGVINRVNSTKRSQEARAKKEARGK